MPLPPAAAATATAIALALFGCLLPVRADALSQVCTSQSSFVWSAIDDTTLADWDCADADSPGADDHFVVAHAVTVTGDLVQDGVTPGIGIEVASGGSLVVAGPRNLVVGEAGLVCAAGSTCRLEGAYRQFGDPNPSALADPDPLASFVAGDVILCPDAGGQSDCTQPALRDRVRFTYPATSYGAGAPAELPHVCAALAAIDVGAAAQRGDVIAFWSPDPLALDEGTDTLFWYEITAASGVDPCFLEFSVHQGTQDQAGYPLSRRELAHYVLGASAAAGERSVELPAGSLSGDDVHNGRMLRLEAGGAAEPAAHRIYDSVSGATTACADGSGPCDLLRLADDRGLPAAKNAASADEDEVWIDYGWETGDPFLVIAPVRVQAAAPATEQTRLELAGDTSLGGVVFDRTDTLLWSATIVDECEDLWLQDLHSGTGDKWNLASGADCRRVCITGGAPVAALDKAHTVVAVTSEAITFEGLGMRHAGDDFFSVISGFGPEITFRRYRGQFKSDNAPSDECIAAGTGAVRIDAKDVECLDAVRSGNLFDPSAAVGASFHVDGVLAVGAQGGFWPVPDPDATASDVTLIGSEAAFSIQELVPVNTDGFVVRDSIHFGGRLLNGATGYLRNGYARDNVVSNNLAILVDDLDVENVAFLRTGAVGGTSVDLVSALHAPSAASWRNVLFLQTAGAPVFQRFWRFRNTLSDLSPYALGGLAFVDLSGAPAVNALQNQAGVDLDDPVFGVNFTAPFCFYGNDQDAPAATFAQLPAGTLTGVDPQFVDPARNRYTVAPGSPFDLADCGIRDGADAPGVAAFRRVHAWSNLRPETLAPTCSNGIDDDGDGSADFPADPGCASESDESEREALLPCDDGLDNDGDLQRDFPHDIGCGSPAWSSEAPACDDGIDNDGDGGIDWDGAGQGAPDPNCAAPFGLRERPGGCGLGSELAPLLAALAGWRRRRREPALPHSA